MTGGETDRDSRGGEKDDGEGEDDEDDGCEKMALAPGGT